MKGSDRTSRWMTFWTLCVSASFDAHSECPLYAEIEGVSDYLAVNLPNFKVHKIIKDVCQWRPWMLSVCRENGWKHDSSPLVWRELVERGGKGMYVGGASDFLEYVREYYDFAIDLPTSKLRHIAEENAEILSQMTSQMSDLALSQRPLHICVTDGTSPLAYMLLPELLKSEFLCPVDGIVLHVYSNIHVSDESLIEGVAMEAQDLALASLRDYVVATHLEEALYNCSLVILLDDWSQLPDEDVMAWMKRVEHGMEAYGVAIRTFANEGCRVCFGGRGPLCYAAQALVMYGAPLLDKGNVVVATGKELQNTANAILASWFSILPTDVYDVYIWGVDDNYRVDVSYTRVNYREGAIKGPAGYTRPLSEVLFDNSFVEELPSLIAGRQQDKHNLRTSGGSMTRMAAIMSVLDLWYLKDKEEKSPEVETGPIMSLGIGSDGSYNIPDGVFLMQPAALRDGKWVAGSLVELSAESQANLDSLLESIMGSMKDHITDAIDRIIMSVLSTTTHSFEVMECDERQEGTSLTMDVGDLAKLS